jgi:hypothetical protein
MTEERERENEERNKLLRKERKDITVNTQRNSEA